MTSLPNETADRLAVIELVATAVLFGDLHEWDRQRECYAERVGVDYSHTLGHAETTARDELLPYWKRLTLGFDVMQHQVTNTLVTLEGDRAKALSHVRATHVLDGDVWVSGGLYEQEAARGADGRWRIDFQKYVQRWQEGDPGVFQRAMQRANTSVSPGARRSAEDLRA